MRSTAGCRGAQGPTRSPLLRPAFRLAPRQPFGGGRLPLEAFRIVLDRRGGGLELAEPGGGLGGVVEGLEVGQGDRLRRLQAWLGPGETLGGLLRFVEGGVELPAVLVGPGQTEAALGLELRSGELVDHAA